MKKIIFICLSMILCSLQMCHSQNKATEIPMISSNWEIPKGTSEFEVFDNRETLLLNGKAFVKNQQFSNGTIEVDVYANSNRSFAGIIFRKQNNTMEEVYMRLHKSSQADAVQYSPTYNEESNWQLYKEYQANVTFNNIGWNKLKIQIVENKAVVFVNDNKVLSIDNLRTENTKGEIGLFSLFNSRFSNFRYSKESAELSLDKTDKKTLDPTIIKNWKITEALPFNESITNFKNFSEADFKNVDTEDSGLLPISKFIEKPSAGNFEENTEFYTVAYTTVKVRSKESKIFSFDYSDKIIVYLNGRALFKGNNGFRSKGLQYQGHLDIDANKLFLNLEKGNNKIICIVIDKANGWGLMGKLD